MITEPLMDIISERALTIARQLQWNWHSTQRTDTSIQITLSITIAGATPQFLTTQVHRLESILEAMGWHLANVHLQPDRALVIFDYELTQAEPIQYPATHETHPEEAT